jgi:hypothetical protein
VHHDLSGRRARSESIKDLRQIRAGPLRCPAVTNVVRSGQDKDELRTPWGHLIGDVDQLLSGEPGVPPVDDGQLGEQVGPRALLSNAVSQHND